MMGTSGNNNTTQSAGSQQSVLYKRHEQLQRWNDSDTSKASSAIKTTTKVKFGPAVAFLAACTASDFDEIQRLVKDEKVDINTGNIDGLTALHQACIDNNLDLIKFLLEWKADVNAKDNEGWTPLHATASCGYAEVIAFLLDNGADVGIVNNDGDLAIDLANEYVDIKSLLRQKMANIDENTVRNAEAIKMQKDVRLWMKEGRYQDVRDPKTGATPVHVAAAKGYSVLEKLLKCPGVDINARDSDGWTPLHAAAHWGHERSCRQLVEHKADMSATTFANQTVFDIAEQDLLPVLKELQLKQQNELNNTTPEETKSTPLIEDLKTENFNKYQRSLSNEIRSSVTRLPQSERSNITSKIAESEKHPGTDQTDPPVPDTPPPPPPSLATLEGFSDDEALKTDKNKKPPASSRLSSLRQPGKESERVSPPKSDIQVEDLEPKKPLEVSKPSEKVVIIERLSPEKPAPKAPAAHTMSAPPSTPVSNVRDEITIPEPATEEDPLTVVVRKPKLEPTPSAPPILTLPPLLPDEGDEKGEFSNLDDRLVSMGRDRPISIESRADVPVIISPPPELNTDYPEHYKPTLSNGNGNHARRISTIMEPSKADESETQRKSVSRTVRRTKRATQGVAADDLAEAKKMLEEKKAKEIENKAEMAVEPPPVSVTTSSILLQQNVPSSAHTASRTRIAAGRQVSDEPHIPRANRPQTNKLFENCDSGRPMSTVSSVNSSTSDLGFSRSRPGSYHGSALTSRSPTSDMSSSDSPDYKRLYEKEKGLNEKLRTDLDRLKEENEGLKRKSSEQRQVDKRLSEYEAQNKDDLSDLHALREENGRLKEDNAALVRVISKLSKNSGHPST